MLQALTEAEIEAANERDRQMFAALSSGDRLALAAIRWRLSIADDREALEHFVRNAVNGIPASYDSQEPPK